MANIDSRNYISVSDLQLDYDNYLSRYKLTWLDIKYGIELNILKPEVITKHAIKIVKDNCVGFDLLIEIASLNEANNEAIELMESLIRLEDKGTKSFSKDKWIYIILNYLYENKDSYTDPLAMIEYVFVDFDYPESLHSLVRYMPGDSNSENGIYSNWRVFLDKSKKELEKIVY